MYIHSIYLLFIEYKPYPYHNTKKRKSTEQKFVFLYFFFPTHSFAVSHPPNNSNPLFIYAKILYNKDILYDE